MVLGAVLVFWRGRIVVVFALGSIQALFKYSQVSMLDNGNVAFDYDRENVGICSEELGKDTARDRAHIS